MHKNQQQQNQQPTRPPPTMASEDPSNDGNPAAATTEGNNNSVEDSHDDNSAAIGSSADDVALAEKARSSSSSISSINNEKIVGVNNENSKAARSDGDDGIDNDAGYDQNDQQKEQEEDDAALAQMMAFQEEQQDESSSDPASRAAAAAVHARGGGGGADNIIMDLNNPDPNVAFLGDDDDDDDDEDDEEEEEAAVHPNFNNPAAIALRQRQALQNAARLNPNNNNNNNNQPIPAFLRNQPYIIRKLFSFLSPSTLRYTPISILAAGLLLHHTLRTRQQFYLALVYLQSSKLAYILLGNAIIACAVSTFSVVTKLFLDGGLRPNERDAIGEHMRWDVTETCLALTIFRSELDVLTAIMFLSLVIMKCLHWSIELRGGHLRMTEEVFVYPDEEDEDNDANNVGTENTSPSRRSKKSWYRRMPHLRLTHIRYYTLVNILLFLDIFAVAHCALSVATHGPSVDILFGFESAILLVSGLSALGSYHLHVIDGMMGVLHHFAEGEHHHVPVGGMAEQEDEGEAPAAVEEGGDGQQEQAQEQLQQQQQEGVESNNQQDAASSTNRPPVAAPKSFAKTLVERLANPWRDHRATLSFAIELQAQAAKFLFYVVFFAIVFTYYGMPINIFREVYVSFQNLRRRLIAFNTYRRLTHNMDKRFESIKDEEELDRLGHTCIICRDTMDLTGGCKKLPGCGHAFHTHCLREWLVQQQTCPTCRADIAANEARRKRERRREETAAAAEAAAAAENEGGEDAAAAPGVDGGDADTNTAADGARPEEGSRTGASESQDQQAIDQTAASQSNTAAAAARTEQQPTSITSTTDDDALPAGWTRHFDERSGRTYYFNKGLRKSTWVKPTAQTGEEQAFMGQKQVTSNATANGNKVSGNANLATSSTTTTTSPTSLHNNQGENANQPISNLTEFPCIYRITCNAGAPVFSLNNGTATMDGRPLSSPQRFIPHDPGLLHVQQPQIS
ncbi:hypothetical protein ACHAXR_011493 [Thalassiosira sp. AJA248-18]